MSYLMVLGRQGEFGLVELESIAGSVGVFGSTAVFDEPIEIDRLGGVVKIGRIVSRQPYRNLDELNIEVDQLRKSEGKLNFGISIYGDKVSPARLKAYGLSLKKRLSGSVRLVTATSNELTAAQLKFNQIPSKGFELLIAVHKNEAIVALTEQYQDIDWYSRRDYDRPARSAKVGMLPPKLAQTLVNTITSKNLTIYDPFCGTGVILQEALLMGLKASGSDIEPTLVESSQANLEWLKHQTTATLPDWSVVQADARTVKIPTGVAVVTEGYLGPNLNPGQKIDAGSKAELLSLYKDALKNWANQLPSGSQVTICIPVWNGECLSIIDALPDLGYTLKDFVATSSRNLIYRRPGQSVGRQVLILTRS